MDTGDPFVTALERVLAKLQQAHQELETARPELDAAREGNADGNVRDKLLIAVHRLETMVRDIDYVAEEIIDVFPDHRKRESGTVRDWNQHLRS